MDIPQPRRRRPARSCIECRRRKIKCDRSNPCGQCVAAHSHCGYKTYSSERAIQHSQATPSEPSGLRQEATTQRQDLGGSSFASNDNRQADQSSGTEPGATENGLRNVTGREGAQLPSQTDPTLHDIVQRLQRLEQGQEAHSLRDVAETGRDILADQSRLLGSYVVLNKSKVVRWSFRMGTAKQVRFPILLPVKTSLTQSAVSIDNNLLHRSHRKWQRNSFPGCRYESPPHSGQ